MKFNDRMVRAWGDAPLYNPLAFMMCFSSDFATELRQEICKAQNWTVSQFSDMMKQENPPTPEQMHVINAVFFITWTRFGKRIASGYKPGKRDR